MRESENEKKRDERAYIEEARRASSIFPEGELIPHEKPDFLLRTNGRILGIEVTELCLELLRAENALQTKVAALAKDSDNSSAASEPLRVVALFSPNVDAVELELNVLVDELVRFVFKNRSTMGCFDENSDCEPELPQGYCNIRIHGANEPPGEWFAFKAWNATAAPKELIKARIAKKLPKLIEYRKAADENWLFIVNDRSLGPGEVYVLEDDIAQWKFAFDFDKVLVFLRERDGTGKVVEVQREH